MCGETPPWSWQGDVPYSPRKGDKAFISISKNCGAYKAVVFETLASFGIEPLLYEGLEDYKPPSQILDESLNDFAQSQLFIAIFASSSDGEIATPNLALDLMNDAAKRGMVTFAYAVPIDPDRGGLLIFPQRLVFPIEIKQFKVRTPQEFADSLKTELSR